MMSNEMKTVHFAKNQNLSRRTLLRGVGVAMALPWLDSMAPAFGQKAKAAIKSTASIRRRQQRAWDWRSMVSPAPPERCVASR